MEKITSLLNAKMRTEVLTALRTAVAGVAQQYGMKIQVRTFRYEEFRADVKLELRVVGDNRFGYALEGEDFKQQAHLFQLPPDILGAEYSYHGKTYCFVGLSRKRRRYPFLNVELSTGRTMNCTESFLKERLKERIAATARKTTEGGGLGLECVNAREEDRHTARGRTDSAAPVPGASETTQEEEENNRPPNVEEKSAIAKCLKAFKRDSVMLRAFVLSFAGVDDVKKLTLGQWNAVIEHLDAAVKAGTIDKVVGNVAADCPF